MAAAEVDKNNVAEDYEKLAKEMENASPLEIMEKALVKFGNDIAIAFRYIHHFIVLICFLIPV